ncbi:MAG: alpha/beta fold hydrolase [Ferrimicrobium sp.]
MFTVSLSAHPVVGWARSGADAGVVYLHGWGRSKADVDSIAALLSADFALYAPDLPGFGETSVPLARSGARGYANLVAPAIQEWQRRYGIREIVVVGHSLGGRVAIELAAGDLVAGLEGIVLVGVPILRPASSSRQSRGYQVVRGLRTRGLAPKSLVAWAQRRYGSRDYQAASGVMREVLVDMVNEEYLEPFSRISCPLELLWGENDSVTPLDLASKAVVANDRANLVVLSGVGHMLPLSRPAEVIAAIERTRVRSRTTGES